MTSAITSAGPGFAPVADLSSATLSFVLPVDHRAEAPAPRTRKRGVSAAVDAAGRTDAGIIAFAPPPGAIGHRTLWAIFWVLLAAALLRSLLFA